ncbi:unnamed protein product [Clonostachys chloroleuca]|uniref:Peptidase M20 dimerisation domain-containing protein n=1 Tax=Clonostachys chloroleuca TaxID=1926264 RepID=A0AA35LTM6_9HYPO|nr:unnamed protein product [Clonostachys chloroleuca]
MTDKPVVTLLQQLMEIPSTSEEENKVGVFLAKYLQDLGYTVELIPIAPDSDRCNVYAYLGSAREARTCLSSHMDTVPPHIDFRREGDVIYGRGACDDKGPLAAQVIALEELRAEGAVKEGDASLLFVVGEEKGGVGMFAANDMDLSWEAIMFGEPTESKLVVGHKGHFVFELHVKGFAAHSGYPDKGKSAISILVALLSELETLDLPRSELLGPSTFHCAKINGGEAFNIIAAEASATCAVRIATGLEDIQKKVAGVISKYPDVSMKQLFGYSETLLDYDIEGLDTMPVAYGTDVPRLKGDHKRYLYGPGSIQDAHGVNEKVAIPDLVEAVAVYKRLVKTCLARQ